MLLTRPDNLKAEHHELPAKLTAACPEIAQLASLTRAFAQLLKPHPANADALELWIPKVRAADLPHLHAFTRGLERDRDAVNAAFTLPYSNSPTEGVNTTASSLDSSTLRHHRM